MQNKDENVCVCFHMQGNFLIVLIPDMHYETNKCVEI